MRNQARLRISDDAAGLARLLELLAEHDGSPEDPVPVAIETPRAADCVPARHRPPGLPRQPDGNSPLPRPALYRWGQVRPYAQPTSAIRLPSVGSRADHRICVIGGVAVTLHSPRRVAARRALLITF